MSERILGILGGMGPQASIRFYELITQIAIEKFGISKNADIPHLLLDSIPVPDLVKSKKDEEETVAIVEREAARLAGAGATAFAMPCNTMHLYASRFQASAGIPFLSMVEAVVSQVKADQRKLVGLIGTITTMQSGLYRAPLEKTGVHVLLPTAEEQEEIANIIHNVIGKGVDNEQRHTLHRILDRLAERGAEAIILGCTELPLVACTIDTTIPLYDSLRLLAQECCTYCLSKKS